MPDAARIHAIMKDCLFQDGEDTTNHVEAEGVTVTVGLHPERLVSHEQEIEDELADLPEMFYASTGGGWSFLNGCLDKESNQWGEQYNVQELLLLGLAIGKVTYLFPRPYWEKLPGGVPYFVIHDLEET
jgi:hypothetical protein